MSVHNGTNYDYKVGEIVQRMVDEGYAEEILVAKHEDGYGWDVWGDKRKFWSWLLTPQEISEFRTKLERVERLLDDILDDHECSLSTRELIEDFYDE
jgi:hypothetical protein